jgi:hypothetical protein
MPTDNLAIWDALFQTDPRHVKPITGKTYQGSSPKPHYVIFRLTEQFGPAGKGFGWNVLHSGYVDSIPHSDGVEKRHECRIRFWWKDEDGQHSVESEGGTKALYKAKAGYWVDDEDAAKKSLTDAITKAASWIGVAGDIFMGRWDDSKYVEALKEDARQKPDPKPEPKPEQRILTKAEGEAIIESINAREAAAEVTAYINALRAGPMAFAADHPKIIAAANDRIRKLDAFGLPPIKEAV